MDAHSHPHHEPEAHGGHAQAHPHERPGTSSRAPDRHTHAGDQAQHDGHEHGAQAAWREWMAFFGGHSHAGPPADTALEASEKGIWAVKVSLIGLMLTSGLQLVIVALSGSVALLADTIHNFSDALTAVPLWLAFTIGRRAANRRYTFGYGRLEDIAGVIIVLVILISAAIAGYESVRKLLNPEPIAYVWLVIAAALVGFLGNEAVAVFRIRVGRQIGSAALVADGQHARVDGLTSLAVLIGAIGVLAGFPLADPLVGILITVAILFVLKDAAMLIWSRLMDAVDPALIDQVEREAATVEGVKRVHDVRARWIGHRIFAELNVDVDGRLTTMESHRIAEEVRHKLLHDINRLSGVRLHVDPAQGHGEPDHHALTAHHEEQGRPRGAV